MASALCGFRFLNNNISTLFCLGQVSLRPPEDCFWSIQHCLAQNTISKGYLLYIIDKKSYNFFKKKERWRPEHFTSERKFILSILRVCRTEPHWWLKYLLEVYLKANWIKAYSKARENNWGLSSERFFWKKGLCRLERSRTDHCISCDKNCSPKKFISSLCLGNCKETEQGLRLVWRYSGYSCPRTTFGSEIVTWIRRNWVYN